MSDRSGSGSWWTQVEVEPGYGWLWDLAGFQITVFRGQGEWLLAHERGREGDPESGVCTVTETGQAPLEHPNLVRFVAAPSARIVRLLPRAADRSVVAKPRVPLHLLPEEESRIYVSSPIWVDITVGEPMHSLAQLPVRQLSDTWFGPNTREGEVAYALRTQARIQLTGMPLCPHRLVTPIHIRNEGDEPLHIDRMNLPVPFLSVYAASDGTLWSEEVSLAQGGSSELASLQVRKGPPPEARGVERLSEPRMVAESSFLVRAFASIFDPMQREE